jgi:hypothetical protein
MVDKKGPHFPAPLKSPEDPQYKTVMSKRVDVAKELDYVYAAITLTRKKLAGRVPLIGFCGAPWTLLCYMVEGGGSKIFKEVKTWIYKYPQATKELLQKIADLCVEYLALQVQAGAQVCLCLAVTAVAANESVDDSGFRFMGWRTLPFFFQAILPPLLKRHLRSASLAPAIERASRGPNDRFRQRRVVCSRRPLQDKLQYYWTRLVA